MTLPTLPSPEEKRHVQCDRARTLAPCTVWRSAPDPQLAGGFDDKLARVPEGYISLRSPVVSSRDATTRFASLQAFSATDRNWRQHSPTSRNEGVPGSSPGVGSGEALQFGDFGGGAAGTLLRWVHLGHTRAPLLQ
jgi:hypothetical protein